jgi:tRNA-intron endonuclease
LSSEENAAAETFEASSNESGVKNEFEQVFIGEFSKKIKHVILIRNDDISALKVKGFGAEKQGKFYLQDYEVLYLLYTKKLKLTLEGKLASFQNFVNFASNRDKDSWARFLIFRDLRTRGYVVREGFGFPIDFRVYERGDYGVKAAKYVIIGLNEGKTMSMAELKSNIEQVSTMGKEAVVAVVERRGEVIYYKAGKWRPVRPQ